MRLMPDDAVEITLAGGTDRERRTSEQLMRLLATHDLSKWIVTRRVLIEQGAIPFSHPVLKLNTRHLDDNSLLLATFIHEQLHWRVLEQTASLNQAIEELRTMAPSIPVGPPRGAESEDASLLHVVVNYLEWQSLVEILGADEAERVIDVRRNDHYTAIYDLVIDRADAIRVIIERCGLRI